MIPPLVIVIIAYAAIVGICGALMLWARLKGFPETADGDGSDWTEWRLQEKALKKKMKEWGKK